MKNNKINYKNLIPVGVATMVLGAAVFGATAVNAQQPNAHESLVAKLATKFNLNKNDVQGVFDEAHKEAEANRAAHFTEMLDDAVADGKLTAAQKALILTKRAELETHRSARPENPGERQQLSAEEREAQRTARQTEMDALKKWADDNNIDMHYLMGGGHGSKGGHSGPNGENGNRNNK